ncbi:regulator of microtubule dynamics protein 1-like [Tribolium madens]|uniref:regulator of microtubule dynamics protein 1-like n=1 Tax=Tribolium madens TaxID=41895 RepID=UPI001CF759AC|nr:regulator of microtubule dynamics protein 1-like [Tribolium madens]
MPLPQNVNVILGAGVFGIVCAATLYVVERFKQDRRRHAMAKDLARLDNELSVLRRELDNLLAAQRQKGLKRAKKTKKSESFASSTTTEDYSSAVDADSSDLEFYDVSDDEGATSTDLTQIDSVLDEGNVTELETCLQQLQTLRLEAPDNPELLWRVAKAHYRLFEKTDQQQHLFEGVEACNAALGLRPELANVHKWLAILLGSRTKFQPLKDKILDGLKVKQHVEAALRLSPHDSVLHHMLGRFCYDMAALKWYERKVATAIAADLPQSTYEEALGHFEEAERLNKDEWKKNLLFIAKCKLNMGLVEEGVWVLEKANEVKTDNGADNEDDKEVKELLKKHAR